MMFRRNTWAAKKPAISGRIKTKDYLLIKFQHVGPLRKGQVELVLYRKKVTTIPLWLSLNGWRVKKTRGAIRSQMHKKCSKFVAVWKRTDLRAWLKGPYSRLSSSNTIASLLLVQGNRFGDNVLRKQIESEPVTVGSTNNKLVSEQRVKPNGQMAHCRSFTLIITSPFLSTHDLHRNWFRPSKLQYWQMNEETGRIRSGIQTRPQFVFLKIDQQK